MKLLPTTIISKEKEKVYEVLNVAEERSSTLRNAVFSLLKETTSYAVLTKRAFAFAKNENELLLIGTVLLKLTQDLDNPLFQFRVGMSLRDFDVTAVEVPNIYELKIAEGKEAEKAITVTEAFKIERAVIYSILRKLATEQFLLAKGKDQMYVTDIVLSIFDKASTLEEFGLSLVKFSEADSFGTLYLEVYPDATIESFTEDINIAYGDDEEKSNAKFDELEAALEKSRKEKKEQKEEE